MAQRILLAVNQATVTDVLFANLSITIVIRKHSQVRQISLNNRDLLDLVIFFSVDWTFSKAD